MGTRPTNPAAIGANFYYHFHTGQTMATRRILKEARTFVKRHKLPFVNLITEPSQEVMMKFGAGKFIGTPTYYIYDPKGEIVGQNIGPLTRTEVEEFITSFEKAA